MKVIYKNWTVHNLIGHPLSEIVFLLSFGFLRNLSNWIHDITLPDHDPNKEGRG